MKINNKLKIILGVLIILALSLIAFIGIYSQGILDYENVLPEYKLGTSLQGKRIVSLAVSTATNEVIYDESGNEIDKIPEGADETKYRKENVSVNAQEVLTQENYENSKDIIEDRLKKYQVVQYETRLNEEDGTIEVSLPNDDNTNKILSYLSYQGKFEIFDSETKELLLDNSQIESASVQYVNNTEGTTILLLVQYNKETQEKLKQISQTYVKTTDAEGKDTTKKVLINLDDSKLAEIYFGYTVTDGRLLLTIGSATTSSDDLKGYITQASGIAAAIDSGKMPIKYISDSSRFIQSNITQEQIDIIIYAAIVVLVIISIYYIVKYRKHGLFGAMSFIGWIALLFITLRYTDVLIGVESIVAIILLIILNTILVNNILNNIQNKVENPIGKAYMNTVDIFVVLLGLFVIFSFINWEPINIVGMIGFWGIIIIAMYNATITNMIVTSLETKNKGE